MFWAHLMIPISWLLLGRCHAKRSALYLWPESLLYQKKGGHVVYTTYASPSFFIPSILMWHWLFRFYFILFCLIIIVFFFFLERNFKLMSYQKKDGCVVRAPVLLLVWQRLEAFRIFCGGQHRPYNDTDFMIITFRRWVSHDKTCTSLLTHA